jgi:hypothetical protein
MSIQTRQIVANHPHLFYQRDSQKTDLTDVNKTQSETIGFLQHLLVQGWYIVLTAVNSDHHPDGDLSITHIGTHEFGWAIDCWPLNSKDANDYMAPSDVHFQKFLSQAQNSPFHYQTGLGGSADTLVNRLAAGPTYFPDSSEDHIHFGCKI